MARAPLLERLEEVRYALERDGWHHFAGDVAEAIRIIKLLPGTILVPMEGKSES